MRVIDAHTHLPLRQAGGDAARAASLLVEEMDSAGVSAAVVIAIEASWSIISKHVTPERVRRAAEPFMYDWRAIGHPTIYAALSDPESLLESFKAVVGQHIAPSEAVVEAASLYPGRIAAVASYCRLSSVDEYLERLEALRARGAVGVKLYPTLHFIRPDDESLEPLYDYMEAKGMLLIVHTGCDPGVWELPAFCAYATPQYVERVARRHRDLNIVVAHMGSYSYLMPGIYFAEALRAARSHDNVYLDTSATTIHQVKRALEKVGPEKILYGSDYPYVYGLSMKDALEPLLEARLPEKVKEAMLWGNAARLLEQAGFRVPA